MALLEVLRQEKKFLLNYIETEKLNHLLNHALHKDDFNLQENGYLVRSLYFDTPYDIDFRQKSDGLSERKKVRVRIYHAESETAKLELKEKKGDFQRKRSLLLNREEAETMIRGNYGFLREREEEFAWEMYTLMEENLYRPSSVIEYDRRAWFVPENDIRITLDGSIRATESSFDLFSENLMFYPVLEMDKTVLEVKFNRFLLSYVRDLLEGNKRFQISASKYSMGRRISMGGIE